MIVNDFGGFSIIWQTIFIPRRQNAGLRYMAEIGAEHTIWTPFEVLSEQLQMQNIIRTVNLIDSGGYASAKWLRFVPKCRA